MIHLLRILFVLLTTSAFAVQVETFYDIIEVDEPVLIELIESPAFQRLKHIHQYGVAYYTSHREEFTRYAHSLGVFALLRKQNCSIKEQIAGLLHDVSHTIFSHVGDWIFNRQNQEVDYQSLTHGDFLEKSGLGNILRKHGYTIEEILPKEELFPALEQPLPSFCADRLDYNLQGAFHQGFITHEEAKKMYHEIKFTDCDWISNDHEVLKKLVRYSIFMSQDCWGNGVEYVRSMWLAEAILKALDSGAITMEDIRFGIDNEIWNKLLTMNDSVVQNNMHKILNSSKYCSYVSREEADLIIISKFRGIDPYVIVDGKKVRITTTDPILKEEYKVGKERMANGWAMKLEGEKCSTL